MSGWDCVFMLGEWDLKAKCYLLSQHTPPSKTDITRGHFCPSCFVFTFSPSNQSDRVQGSIDGADPTPLNAAASIPEYCCSFHYILPGHLSGPRVQGIPNTLSPSPKRTFIRLVRALYIHSFSSAYLIQGGAASCHRMSGTGCQSDTEPAFVNLQSSIKPNSSVSLGCGKIYLSIYLLHALLRCKCRQTLHKHLLVNQVRMHKKTVKALFEQQKWGKSWLIILRHEVIWVNVHLDYRYENTSPSARQTGSHVFRYTSVSLSFSASLQSFPQVSHVSLNSCSFIAGA